MVCFHNVKLKYRLYKKIITIRKEIYIPCYALRCLPANHSINQGRYDKCRNMFNFKAYQITFVRLT